MRILRRAMLLSLLLAATLPAAAAAHASLLSSTPSADTRVAALPPAILLTFDDVLTKDSSFVVLGSAGLTVATGALDAADPKSLTAPMPALADGSYEVHWTAVSADDGFVERGSFKFKVALATAAPTTAATTNPTTLPSVLPTTGSTTSPAPGATGSGDRSGTGDVLIPIVVVVVLVGAGLFWFLRRRSAA